MKYTPIPCKWKEYIYHRGSSWIFQSILRKEKDTARQAVFLTPLNPFGMDRKEEKPHFDYTVPQKVPFETRWKYNQDAVNWVRLSKAQDQGLQFWQTKSFAIMVYATKPGDCIDRVIAQNGDQVIFERLATPKACTQRSRCSGTGEASSMKEQQPQQPISYTDVKRFWKQRTTW